MTDRGREEAERIFIEWLDAFTHRQNFSNAAKDFLINKIATALSRARAAAIEEAAKNYAAIIHYTEHEFGCQKQNGLDRYCEKCETGRTQHYCLCGLSCTCGLEAAITRTLSQQEDGK